MVTAVLLKSFLTKILKEDYLKFWKGYSTLTGQVRVMYALRSIPCKDGFHMPAEFEKHTATILVWPVRPGSWPHKGVEAQKKFTQIAREISKSEIVYMLAGSEHFERVTKVFEKDENIKVLRIDTNDSWARDIGPTFVKNDEGEVRGINWKFNAWGGEVDGLYKDWDLDNETAYFFCHKLDYPCYEKQDFVLEGGSIHSDGQGTILVTESCLLSAGRNPHMTKAEIDKTLRRYLGAKKVIWLPRGIYNDETNEHVDNVCAFTSPGEVVLAWTDDVNDPQYELSKACLDLLEKETDAKGRKIKVHKMLIPKVPVTVTAKDLEGYEFEEGEDVREVGERLAASYVNFYIANDRVLVPQFGDENDSKAIELLEGLFPDREIVGIDARCIIVGGGNIHCITQQIP